MALSDRKENDEFDGARSIANELRVQQPVTFANALFRDNGAPIRCSDFSILEAVLLIVKVQHFEIREERKTFRLLNDEARRVERIWSLG